MNDFVALIVASALAAFGGLLILLQREKGKTSKLQKEQDVAKIKTDAKSEVSQSDLQPLLDKLNRKIADDKRRNGT